MGLCYLPTGHRGRWPTLRPPPSESHPLLLPHTSVFIIGCISPLGVQVIDIVEQMNSKNKNKKYLLSFFMFVLA